MHRVEIIKPYFPEKEIRAFAAKAVKPTSSTSYGRIHYHWSILVTVCIAILRTWEKALLSITLTVLPMQIMKHWPLP